MEKNRVKLCISSIHLFCFLALFKPMIWKKRIFIDIFEIIFGPPHLDLNIPDKVLG